MANYALSAWDLSELAKRPASKDVKRQEAALGRLAEQFASRHARLSAKMSAAKFGRLISDTEEIYRRASVVSSYAGLLHASDVRSDSASAMSQSTSKAAADAANKMVFADLWWKKKVGRRDAARLMAAVPRAAGYLRALRLEAKYALSEGQEQAISTLDVTGRDALVKLYDRITSSYSYSVGGKKGMTREQLSGLVRSRSGPTRKAAYTALLSRHAKDRGVLAEIYQNIVMRQRSVGIEMRGYSSPMSMRNMANDIDDRTVSALLESCKDNAGIFRRFFLAKAKMASLKRLRRYDLYAPASRAPAEKKVPYAQAVRMVLESLGRLSPRLAGHARAVIDAGHIDSQVRAGKRDGAFCSTVEPKIIPYVMLSYTGRLRDAFTLAHELGHAVHSTCAAGQSILVQQAPLPLAETASTFSEMLLYDSIEEGLEGPQRRAVLSEKIDDFYATIMRQAYFTLFEQDAHQMISSGAAAPEISAAYLAGLRGQFGRSVQVSEDFGDEWCAIPHFYHAPFYCYAYAFGNLLAVSLFGRYKKEGRGFAGAYEQILAAGGALKPEALLGRHGIDISSKGFWQGGFDQIGAQVRRLEKSVY